MANLTKFKNTLHVKAINLLEDFLDVSIDLWKTENIQALVKKEPNDFLSVQGCGPQTLYHIGMALNDSSFTTMSPEKWVKRKSTNSVRKPDKDDKHPGTRVVEGTTKAKKLPEKYPVMIIHTDDSEDETSVECVDGYMFGQSACVQFVEDMADAKDDILLSDLGDWVIEYEVKSIRRVVPETVKMGDPE